MFEALQSVIVSQRRGTPIGGRFGSACDMADYVRAASIFPGVMICEKVLDRLKRAGAAGNLPMIPSVTPEAPGVP